MNRVAVVLLALACSLPAAAQTHDLVLSGGRVIDPETGLDGIRNVGVRDGRIATIAETPLEGSVTIDVAGLVVAPGFIDLHAHGLSDDALKYRVRDGVTTALELEGGMVFIGDWLAASEGKMRCHYGASVSHGGVRAMAMPSLREQVQAMEPALRAAATGGEGSDELDTLFALLEQARNDALPDEAVEAMYRLLDRGLAEGGLGFGVPHQYYPGATHKEIFRVFQLAAEREAPIYTHVRRMHMDAMQEVIANAAATGAPLHIVHVNSMSLGATPEILELIEGARAQGLDVTTEAYPYTAASTSISSAIFDGGWKETLGISYGDLQWQDTGERLTAETFAKYYEQGGIVIIHMMKEPMIELALATPFVMVASDAMPYSPGAHPRSAGTFARVLGRYVRERGTLDLATALRKMTLMPARRLETIAPAMKQKGRVQIGADADLVVFDPDTVIDRATFEGGLDYSEGILHVLVSGTPVVRDGELVEGAFPGEPVLGRHLDE